MPVLMGLAVAIAFPLTCQAYYQCTGLAAYYLKCPTGLLFNDQQLYCDW